ncbi:hypothetical protein [Kribbella pittospori]|uniref:hypothetical protein n=1 Tax=Kribbella pittospori TaxID=722689 RepID=UPI0013F3AE41|nr:hypothetical protein [Kribbella pittospori]
MIEVLAPAEAVQAAPELAEVFVSAFGAPGYDEDRADAERFATEQLPVHAERDDFKLVAARSDGRIVGFAYGFTGQRGQWWPDRVAAAVPAELPTSGSVVTSRSWSSPSRSRRSAKGSGPP